MTLLRRFATATALAGLMNCVLLSGCDSTPPTPEAPPSVTKDVPPAAKPGAPSRKSIKNRPAPAEAPPTTPTP